MTYGDFYNTKNHPWYMLWYKLGGCLFVSRLVYWLVRGGLYNLARNVVLAQPPLTNQQVIGSQDSIALDTTPIVIAQTQQCNLYRIQLDQLNTPLQTCFSWTNWPGTSTASSVSLSKLSVLYFRWCVSWVGISTKVIPRASIILISTSIRWVFLISVVVSALTHFKC